jgi:hypothetical protein
MYEDRLQEVSVYARGMVHKRYIRDNANVSRTNGGTTEHVTMKVRTQREMSVVLRIVVNLP